MVSPVQQALPMETSATEGVNMQTYQGEQSFMAKLLARLHTYTLLSAESLLTFACCEQCQHDSTSLLTVGHGKKVFVHFFGNPILDIRATCSCSVH